MAYPTAMKGMYLQYYPKCNCMIHCKQSDFLRKITFVVLLCAGSAAYGQDVDCSVNANCNDPYCQFAANIEKGCNCFDGADNDGDGKADKADSNCAVYYGLVFIGDGSDCSIVPPGANTPFDMVNAPITSDQNTADTQSKISVGDVDGDGIPDAVITSKWNSEIRVVATADGQADGTSPGDVKSDFKTTGQGAKIFSGTGDCAPKNLLFEHENLIADIDGDGKAELFGVVSNRGGNPSTPPTCFFLVAFTYAEDNLIPMYNAIQIGTDRPGTFGIADMDGDGKAEIYMRDRIYAAETGALLATGNGDWDMDITAGPVAVDVVGDDKMELVCGTKIYSIPDFSNRTPATPATLSLVADMNTVNPAVQAYVKLAIDPVEYGIDTHSMTSVADIDRDGNMDVVISGALGSENGPTAVFYWNVAKGTVSYYLPTDPLYANGWPWGTGRVNLGDANGDGKTDLTFMAGSYLHSLTTDAAGNLVPLWPAPRKVNDSRSGVLTVSIYDFDNDGNPEVVYRDSQELVVVDGATGTQKLWSAVCQSHTYTEGVVIADVNGDGATDICVPCNTNNSFNVNDPIQQQALGQFRLYYSSGNEWLPTRKVWNQPGYFVVNINDDLTLPFPQLDQSLVFGEGDCANGLPGPQMPMNVFLNQVPYLSASGCPVYPAPDLSFAGDNPDNPGVDENGDGIYAPAVEVIPPICGDLGISVRFNIINDGDLPITDNIPVSFFIGDPTDPSITSDSLIHSTTLAISNLAIDSIYRSPFITFNGTGSAFRLYIVLNNDGAILPIDPAGSVTNECRIDNNIYSVFIQPDPFITRIEKIRDNFKCENTAADNGELRLRIFKGTTEVTDYSQYAFQWYTGTAASYTPIAGATNYNLLGLPEGDYTAIVTNTAKGCVGIPVDTTILRQGNDPEVIINVLSDQTVCNPPNGALQAQVTGGNLGYTFEWFDIALNPLGITGATATSLVAGNYIVRVSKDGCSKNSLPQTVDGPVVPDATASTLVHVVDCLNPNSGSVTATAFFSGAAQDPSAYKFEWYFYDNVTATRGSILPAANGTGETRTGLPVGHYQVLITNIATQCQAIQSPVTEIIDQRVVPTALITELAPQTSCDPGNPNGRLSAEIQVAGVPQDLSAYKIEWFKGDNTLPSNLHTNVSGMGGSIAEQVAGGGSFYTVKVTTPTNCSDVEKLIITEDLNVPVVTLTATDNSICDPALAASAYNGSVSAVVTFGGTAVTDFSNYELTWHQGALNTDPVIAGETTPLLTGRNGGYYTLVVERTDLSCVSTPVSAEVKNVLTLPLIKTDSIPSTNCVVNYHGNIIANGQASVTTVDGAAPNANYAFLWSDNSSPTNVDAQTASAVQNIQGGYMYTVQVTNTLTGCRNTDNVQLPDASVIPVVSLAVAQPNSICDPSLTDPAVQFNGKIETAFLTPSGNASDYIYAWRNVTDNTALGITPPVNTGPGVTLVNEFGGLNGDKDYSVIAENTVLGCSSGAAQVYLPNDLQLPLIRTDSVPSTNCVVNYNGTPVSNGEVTVSDVDGGAPFANYTFLWSDDGVTPTPVNANAATVTNLEGGYVYTVMVTSNLTGCVNTHAILLPDNQTKPVIDVSKVSDNVNCDAVLLGSTGQLQAVVSYNGIQLNTPGVTSLPGEYAITWSTTANGDMLSGLAAGSYTAAVVNETLGCTSDPDGDVVLDAFVYPAIDIPVPTDQTSCDSMTPNGGIQATVTDGLGSTFVHAWYQGIGTGGAQLSTASAQADGATTTLVNMASNDYTIFTRNETTGCETIRSAFIPDNITYPVFAFTSTDPVTTCGLNPNGAATPNVTGVSNLPDYNYTVFYLETFTGGTYPTDPTVIKGGIAYNYSNPAFAQPPVYGNLAPGYISAMVVDNNTRCESNPVTAPIINATEEYDITIDGTSNAGFCGGDGGGIAVTIERTDNPGVACATCTYEWYKATPVNTDPINFFNNPPDMGGVPLETLVVNEDLGWPVAPPGVGAGTYTLIVIDTDPAHLGCGNYFVETVDFAAAPLITVVETHVSKCIAPFDGQVSVSVTGGSLVGYSIEIFSGNGPAGTLLTASGIPTAQPAPLNLSASMLEDGQYYVQVVDYEGVNANCPLGSVHALKPLAFDPLITLNQVLENTSCDPAASADGKVELTANADPQQIAATDFRMTAASPAPLGLIIPRDLPDDGTSSGLMDGFAPQTYTLTVTDNNSGCFANAVVNIPDQPVMPTIFEAQAFDDSYCAPASNGQIVITQVGVGIAEPVANYEFEWYAAADVAPANLVYSDIGGGATTGDIFDETKTGWSIGTAPGAGNGNRQYFVRGRKITGSGTGCFTPLVQKDVLDVHKTPSLTVTTFDNTSCIPSEGEGVIRAVTDIASDPLDANVQNAGTYTYTWTPDPVSGNTSGSGGAANGAGIARLAGFDITALTDNTYTVTSVNAVNGCAISTTATISTNPLPITLLSYNTENQLMCNADGSIRVAEVVIDASRAANPAVYNYIASGDPLTNLTDNFNFRWFNAADDGDGNASTFNNSGPIQNAGTDIDDDILTEDATLTAQPYPAMGQGTYYVMATRKPGMSPGAGCTTVPVRVEITKDVNTPEITALTPFANTSCETGTVEGRIELTVATASTVASESNATYTFNWVQSDPAGNPGGSGAASNVANATATNLMTIPQGYVTPPASGPALKDDTYTLTVTNDYSGCSVTGQAVITPQRYPVTLISFTQQDQLICFADGNITITQVAIDGSKSGLGFYNYNTPADVRSNFDFSWFDANNDNDNNAGTFNGTLALNDGINTITDAVLTEDGTQTAQPYAGMKAGSYYVVATRKTGMSPGAGCSAEPVRVNIADLHADPVMSLTYEPNSSCDPVNPNGIIVATTAEKDGSTTDTYSFNWSLNGGALAPVTVASNPANNIGRLDDAADGKYFITATNTSNTGCEVSASIDVLKNLNISTPNIIDVATTDPVDCYPSGTAAVTRISIGGITFYNNPPDNLDNTFDYKWYKNDYTPANEIAGAVDHDLLNIEPDKYYVVVEDVTTACKSSPKEVVILADDIVYPVISISQTQRQISCPASLGTGRLVSVADGKDDTDPDYAFTWYDNLTATGIPIANTSTISGLIAGDYSVSVTNAVTGCSSADLYIISNEMEEFFPQLALTTQPREHCLVNDGSLLAREVGWDPNSGYPFAPDYTTEIYPGANADITQPGTVMGNVSGFNRNWLISTLDVGTYTVKIRDNNTGCIITAEADVQDGRTPPIVTIIEDNPLINCDPARPNGQLSATADGGLVGGYQFDWYGGNSVSGTILGDNNKLIALPMGAFTVRVTNDLTGCYADLTGDVTDGRLVPPSPTAVLIFDRTRCDYPDGWVAANVGGITLNYSFDWYDGNTTKPAPDFTGVNYRDRDIGLYTVTAMDQITGCISLPESVEVKDMRVIPEVIIHTQPSYCDELPGAPGGNGTAEIELAPSNIVTDQITWTEESSANVIGIGSYLTNILPGFYQANVVTSYGCEAAGVGEVKTEVFSYNLVSSNGDRKNDNFMIDCISQFPNNNVKIFNRSGVLVYEADGYDNNEVVFKGIGERGVYTIGNELPVGTYFYIIDKRDGSKPKTGYLELVR
ncbi:MAG: gliding motility-associated C-terminal domain-containing protein [Croceibacterium sp.]